MKFAEEQQAKIETLLIAGVIAPQLLGFVLGSTIDSTLLVRVSLAFLFLVSSFYWYISKSVKLSITLLFVLFCLAFDLYEGNAFILNSARIAIRVICGIWIFYSTVKYIIREKNFELIPFLTGLFLMLNVLLFTFLGKESNLQMILLFGSTFTLATVMYYENFWESYSRVEKHWLVISLCSLIIDVLILSKRIF